MDKMSKKLFTTRYEWREQTDMLNDEELGMLYRSLINYACDGVLPTIENRVVALTFKQLVKDVNTEVEKYNAIVKRNQMNGAKGGRPKTQNNPNETQNNPLGFSGFSTEIAQYNINNNNINNINNNIISNINENPNETQNNPLGFDAIWDMYDKKVDRKKCAAKWARLTEAVKSKIFEHVPKYVEATPDKRYRKNFLTYLNGECWNDDLETITNQSNNVSNYETQRINERRERQQTIANIMAEAITQ